MLIDFFGAMKMADTQPRRPGRPRKYDEGTVSVSCRLTAEQVRFLDELNMTTRSDALNLVIGFGVRQVREMRKEKQQ